MINVIIIMYFNNEYVITNSLKKSKFFNIWLICVWDRPNILLQSITLQLQVCAWYTHAQRLSHTLLTRTRSHGIWTQTSERVDYMIMDYVIISDTDIITVVRDGMIALTPCFDTQIKNEIYIAIKNQNNISFHLIFFVKYTQQWK